MANFKIISNFKPTGDQPQAIEKLTKGFNQGMEHQVLLGVTGSGKSVAGKTPVLIKSGKIIRMEDIGKLIDKIFNDFKNKIKYINDSELMFIKDLPKKYQFETYSFNPLTRTSSWKPVIQLSRHHSPNFLYKVRTTCGREIIVTGDHNFFVLRGGKLQLLQTTALQRTDYIPVPIKLDSPGKVLFDFQFIDYLPDKKYYVHLPNFRSGWSKLEKQVRFILSSAKIHCLLQGTERLSLVQYKQLLNINPKFGADASIGTKSKDYQFPMSQRITPSFLRFLGYYIAEGHSTAKYFVISSADKEIIRDFSATLNDLGLKDKHRPKTYDYQISSSFWTQLLIELCGKSSKLKHLPNFWMRLSNPQLASLLSAYFSADGGVNGQQVSCITASNQLASEIMYALLRFGIIARVRHRQIRLPSSDKVGTYWEIIISGQMFLTIFLQEVGFCLKEKQNKLIRIIQDHYNTNVDIVPTEGCWLKKIRTKLKLSQHDISQPLQATRSLISLIEGNQRKPSRELFQKMINLLKEEANKQRNLSVLEMINEGENLLGLFWSTVKLIGKVAGDKYVYDLAVEDNETFLAGMGGVFVHNTFTMANVIQNIQKPTLIISHNKTLAGQLAQEFKSLFPNNAVEYFVSYYDYYQPEAYIPQSDTYIEKETEINEEIEKLRLSATASLMSRKDVVVVASVSAIYNLGSPIEYGQAILEIKAGMKTTLQQAIKILTKMYYLRNEIDFFRGSFRVKGDTLDIFPSYKDEAIRVEFLGDKVEKVSSLNPLTGDTVPFLETQVLYPAKHYITPEQRLLPALEQIECDLNLRLKQLKSQGKLLEAQRIEQRTRYDLEMIQQFGYCNGIENYSRYFDGRNPGDPPYSLLNYFPKDFLLIIDESHITIPQIRGMYNGDRSRKETLIDFGFRLPSALDNRPLKFEEFLRAINQVIYTTATPNDYELSLASREGITEQLVRPTGILDPQISVRPIKGQIDDLVLEIKARVQKGERTLVTTLTKRTAEDLAEFLKEKGIKVHYLHSDVTTLERGDILQSLRLGEYDVIVGINLLREGLDLPEVSLVAILDADKEGFLRSRTSLVQTMGRAARHINGFVIMYADEVTDSMKAAIDEVDRRRKYQEEYNRKHHITPRSIQKALRERLIEKVEELEEALGKKDLSMLKIPVKEREKMVKNLEAQMKEAAEALDFEEAARLRDQIKELSV
ncbi:excinuclease ABC subunit UvrB [Patescibacteria group bacterium]|nr:excinuclease ABC subunit UvrB [Patescibacteria group bacterium]